MKKVLIGILGIWAMALATAVPADERNFALVNATGYPIKFVGVNPPGDNVYNENELDGVLRDGARIEVKFSGADKGCAWNIKVIWADDNTSSFFRNLDLCKINTVTLKYNRATDTASYVTD